MNDDASLRAFIAGCSRAARRRLQGIVRDKC